MHAEPTTHSLESKLIIAGCQTTIAPGSQDLLEQLLEGPIDWKYVMDVTRRNAVKPLFSSNMLRLFGERLPPDIRQTMENELQMQMQSNMFQTAKVVELVRFFGDHGIEAIPFKGPMLAIQAYGNPALRMYGDLDILVQPRHFKDAVRLLSENGYKPLTSVSWIEKTNWYIGRVKDIYFVDESGSVKLELHWKLSGSHFGLPKEMNGLWQRLERINLAGTLVPSLSFNDLLIYLCLHGSRHGWERLAWICDVNELIRSEKDIDWDLFFKETKRFGCENVVSLGMCLIHEFFDFNLPDHFRDRIKNGQEYVRITEDIRKGLFSDGSASVDMSDRYHYHLKLKERSSDRWKLHFHYLSWYARIILTPNEIDEDVIHFPNYLYPLYYVTRPMRLIYSFVRGKLAPPQV